MAAAVTVCDRCGVCGRPVWLRATVAWGIVEDNTLARSDQLMVQQLIHYFIHGVVLLVLDEKMWFLDERPVDAVGFGFCVCARRVKLFSFSFSSQTFFYHRLSGRKLMPDVKSTACGCGGTQSFMYVCIIQRELMLSHKP